MYTKCNLSNAMKNLYMKLICNKTCVLFKSGVRSVFVRCKSNHCWDRHLRPFIRHSNEPMWPIVGTKSQIPLSKILLDTHAVCLMADESEFCQPHGQKLQSLQLAINVVTMVVIIELIINHDSKFTV